MDRRKNSLTKWTVGSQLPMLALPGRSLIEIVGCSRVLIENHLGVLVYGEHEIVVCVKTGYICITGAVLKLSMMSKEQLVVTGCIHEVKLKGAYDE